MVNQAQCLTCGHIVDMDFLNYPMVECVCGSKKFRILTKKEVDA